MDSSGFNSLVKNYTCLTEDECSSLSNLSKAYPYSQIIKLLYARAAHDLKHNDKEISLHTAAVYAGERMVLKEVMTSPRKERAVILPPPGPKTPEAKVQQAKVQESSIQEVKVQAPKIQEAKIPEAKVPVVNVKSGVPEVKVQELKIQEVKSEPPKIAEIKKVIDEKKESTPAAAIIRSEDITLSGDALREDLFHELEKLQRLTHQFSDQLDEFNSTGEIKAADPKTLRETGDSGDPLIEDIKTTKKKLKIVNPKQKEQIEIIDQFIKTQPVIPKPNADAIATDLSEDSGIFNDNIVSETLVQILLKQGKKDKAIEVLKKLIWKFPQKKAYFAAQIESLKS